MSLKPYQSALESVNAGRLKCRDGYCEVPTEIFVAKVDVGMGPLPDIEFHQLKETGFEAIPRQGGSYSPLALSVHRHVWVRESDMDPVRAYAQKILTQPDSNLPQSERMESLRRSAMLVVEDLFENPSPENISKSVKVVGSFVHVLMKDPKAYLFLAKLSSHDPYTLQHSVGTAVNSIILARKIGITDEQQLLEIGLAGLLHDVGKVKVKKEIINKNGPLDELEWEEMRQHSLAGYEIVKDNPELTERTKRAILEHHEDKHGTGYPLALKSDEVDLYSKIVCICDVFNALTTNRSYSKARTPFDAFQLMRDKLSHKIDEELFKQLVLVYGGQVDA